MRRRVHLHLAGEIEHDIGVVRLSGRIERADRAAVLDHERAVAVARREHHLDGKAKRQLREHALFGDPRDERVRIALLRHAIDVRDWLDLFASTTADSDRDGRHDEQDHVTHGVQPEQSTCPDRATDTRPLAWLPRLVELPYATRDRYRCRRRSRLSRRHMRDHDRSRHAPHAFQEARLPKC